MVNPPSTRVNWPEIFVAYCAGCPLEELSQVYGIELSTLSAYEVTQGWAKLRASIPQNAAVSRPEAGAKLKLIEENRRENLKIWVELRQHAAGVIAKLCKGDLKMEKLFSMGKLGVVVREEVEPSPGDLVNLATYLRTITDGTYRALGDFQAQEKPGQDASAGAAGASAPAITIILPGVIAEPRDQRKAIDVPTQVIDLRPLTSTETSSPPDDVAH